ncbi:stage II sporulation protein R [Paenibacillus swuensis]|uniref:Stage II sporulation protein R n=1 Tax=Paenibacillus swuensis TaxID=1178515 RepID=A0A172THY7_9BACL|nr:stage II sporulation protein R [Paenibacillus swuensis]ANE46651.1 stage II sporulation protein R [Paenibacillus swuensis]
MVKRSKTSVRYYIYLLFAMMMLVMNWQSDITHAMAVSGTIPQESIRLRILANSDTPVDQWTKRQVKDAVVEQMNQWVTGPTTLAEAREIVASRLPEIEKVIGEEIRKLGFDYSYKAELAVVDFPTKMYGNRQYPAGDYEALRITLGQGNGQNWWCVLFPPLCFVDGVSGENVAAASAAEAKPVTVKTQAGTTTANADATTANTSETSTLGTEQPEIRFFLVDLLVSIANMVQGWFA